MNAVALRSRISSLIVRYGIIVTLSSFSTNTTWVAKFDTIEGKKYWQNSITSAIVYVDPGPTNTTINAVEKAYRQEEIDGTEIQASDRRFLVMSDVAITSDDRLIVENKTYQILPPIKIIGVQGVPIAYEVHCRG